MTGRRSHGRLSALNGVVHQGNTASERTCRQFLYSTAQDRQRRWRSKTRKISSLICKDPIFLLSGFHEGRTSGGWRNPDVSPFALLVTEILLSHTRARSVEPVAMRLLARFPQPTDLAHADVGDVTLILRPLGLHHKRALRLIACARQLLSRFDGEVPRSPAQLMTLPYVGRYATNAVACFGFDRLRSPRNPVRFSRSSAATRTICRTRGRSGRRCSSPGSRRWRSRAKSSRRSWRCIACASNW